MKILVADDDEISRIYLERALKSQGYIIEGAHNGAVALEKALNDKKSIVSDQVTVEKEKIDEMYSQAIKRKLEQKIKELEESQQSYKALAENLPGIVYRVFLRENKRVQFFNKAAKSVTGYSEQEFTPGEVCSIYALLLPEDQSKVVNVINFSILDNKPFAVEYRIRHKDGSIRYMLEQGTPIYGSDQKPLYIEGVIFDISERKRAEEALRESEDKFEGIAATANDAIILMDNDGKIEYWNDAARKIFGYSKQEMIKEDMHFILAPRKYHNAYHEGFAKLRVTGEGHAIGKTLELEAKRKDGTVFPIELSVSALKLKGKWHSIGILRDITERKQAEEAIRQARDEALRASKVKTNFLLMMSHELRTPMNAILGFSQILMQNTTGELNEKQERFLENIISGGNKLNDILGYILDVIKMDKGKLELCIETISVPETIDGVISFIEENAKAKNVVVVKKVDPQLEHIESDKQKLKQILVNLLDDAVKFSKPDGGIVTISSTKEEDMAKFSVSDTGIGIKKEDMDKLFQRFTQLDSGTTRAHGGIGIGLAISREFVDMLGGNINVESKYGEGTTFTLLIPLKCKLLRASCPE